MEKSWYMENLQQCSETLVLTLWQLEVGNDVRMTRINLLLRLNLRNDDGMTI